MRDWPMFRAVGGKQGKVAEMRDELEPRRISELIMQYVPGSPAEKLAWLEEQCAEGKMDADDPEEIAQAEALLMMLGRLSGSKADRRKRHLDDLLDAGLEASFPASDPVTVGHSTGTEPPSQPTDRAVADFEHLPKKKTRRSQAKK
jgi:hypothetical protein